MDLDDPVPFLVERSGLSGPRVNNELESIERATERGIPGAP
jgi:hypothetical protein